MSNASYFVALRLSAAEKTRQIAEDVGALQLRQGAVVSAVCPVSCVRVAVVGRGVSDSAVPASRTEPTEIIEAPRLPCLPGLSILLLRLR